MIIDDVEYTHCRICKDLIRSEYENEDYLINHMINEHEEIVKQYHMIFDEAVVNSVNM